MWSCWTVKKAEHRRIDAFELWCWRRLLRVPWTARRSSQSILKEISPGCSLEGLTLKLKLQYFGHLMWRVDSVTHEKSKLSPSIFLCWTVFTALSEASSQPPCRGLKVSGRVQTDIQMGFCFYKIGSLETVVTVTAPPWWSPYLLLPSIHAFG